ncbi:hypothetical protein [uncultured Roseivirga sp.]|uniref:hypothetical protein n=1 Tax=uncultured Roseivirga sp. TaxID=543088 RepID=UPI0030DCD607
MFLIPSCYKTSSSSEIIAEKIKEINEYLPGYYVVKVTDIIELDGEIFILDGGLSQLIRSDHFLEEIKIYGKRGYESSEMMSPEILVHDEKSDLLYIYDRDKRNLMSFDTEREVFESEISLGIVLYNRPIIKNSILLFTNLLTDSTNFINRYDLNKKEHLPKKKLPNDYIRSYFGYNIIESNNKFTTINGYGAPFIDTFNEGWELTNSVSLANYPLIARGLAIESNKFVVKNLEGVPSGVKAIISERAEVKCVKMYNDILYLLVLTRDGASTELKSNSIMKFKNHDGDWQSHGVISLPEYGYYQTFAIFENGEKLLTFEKNNGVIELFNID